MSHTPGPWKTISCGQYHVFIASEAQGFTKWPVAEKLLLRDASLIAAAPEMLAALEDVQDFLKQSGYRTDIVKQAIAKAKGES